MKKIFLLFFFVSVSLSAQKDKTIRAIVVSNDSLDEKVIPVTFEVVESIPLAPGCENLSISEQVKCFDFYLTQHIKRHFQYPEEAAAKNHQGRVNVQIIIDKEGNVANIKTGGIASPILKNEAKRIASLLPKFTPAYQNGKPVTVKFTFPLNFIMR